MLQRRKAIHHIIPLPLPLLWVRYNSIRRLEDKVSSLAEELHFLNVGSRTSSPPGVFVNGDRFTRSGDRPVFPRQLRGSSSLPRANYNGMCSHEWFGDNARLCYAGWKHFASKC